MADSHRHHTEDGGEGCHDDRTQTRATCIDHGGAYAQTAFAVEDDVVDEHNTVLHHNTDKHDGTDHRHDVEVGAGSPKDEYDTGECEEQRCHDDSRVGERLKLSSHHYVDEYDDYYSEHSEVGKRILLVFVGTRKFYGNSGGYVELVELRLHLSHNLAHRYAVDGGLHGNDTFAVLTLDSRRVEAFHYFTHVLDAHALTLAIVDENVFDVFE